jgi:hypothetical protein
MNIGVFWDVSRVAILRLEALLQLRNHTASLEIERASTNLKPHIFFFSALYYSPHLILLPLPTPTPPCLLIYI